MFSNYVATKSGKNADLPLTSKVACTNYLIVGIFLRLEIIFNDNIKFSLIKGFCFNRTVSLLVASLAQLSFVKLVEICALWVSRENPASSAAIVKCTILHNKWPHTLVPVILAGSPNSHQKILCILISQRLTRFI